MAIFTFDSVKRDTPKQKLASKVNHKVVNIEEYRGTVLLPPRRGPRPMFAMPQWSSDPLSAA